jgi:hypothetical protein
VNRQPYRPLPLRAPEPEAAPPPPGPWQAAARHWLDVIDGNDHIIATCDDWDTLMDLVLVDSFRPGKFRLTDGTGRRVAELVVDGPGQWRVYSAVPGRR